MATNSILLVEDNPDDEALTLRAFRKNNVTNEVVVARDGVEALDYLFGTGTYANRDVTLLPRVVILDLKPPKIDGLEVLRGIRAALQTPCRDTGLLQGYGLGANSYVRKPVDFAEFVDAVRQLGLYWLLVNERPPVWRKN